MAAVIETRVIFKVPIIHREITISDRSVPLTDNQGYAKIGPPLFYEDPNLSQAHIVTDPKGTNICLEQFEGTADNILFDQKHPAQTIFQDVFMGLRRITTVTHMPSLS